MKTTRRNFIKQATLLAACGAGWPRQAQTQVEAPFRINRQVGDKPRMELRFFAYELRLRHVFTVASSSRSTTPDVQVEIHYDGLTGYGEASMPPYLQRELGST